MMAKRVRTAWMEIDLYMSEVKDIAKAAGAKIRMLPYECGWDFDSVEDEDKMKLYIVKAATEKARGK